MKILRLLLSLAILAMSLSGCVVASTNPLCAPEEAIIDEALLGSWNVINNDTGRTDGHALVLYGENNQMYFTLYDNNMNLTDFVEAYATKIDDDSWLSIKSLSIGKKDEPLTSDGTYLLAMYSKNDSTTGSSFAFRLFDTDYMTDCILKGELTGVISDDMFKNVTLTDTSAQLVDFIKKHPKHDFLVDTGFTLKKDN